MQDLFMLYPSYSALGQCNITSSLALLVYNKTIHLIFYYVTSFALKLSFPFQLTGGGSGIGRLIALKLADLGAVVVTWDINERGNKETVKYDHIGHCKVVGLHSTEVAQLLLNMQPQVRFPVFLIVFQRKNY